MARTRRALSALTVALAVAGCGRQASSGGTGACTLIGCADQVTVVVDQPGERPLEACVGATCSSSGPDVLVVVGAELGDLVEVVVRVAGGGAEVARRSVEPVQSRPNGEQCPPECRAVPRLRLTVDDELVPA